MITSKGFKTVVANATKAALAVITAAVLATTLPGCGATTSADAAISETQYAVNTLVDRYLGVILDGSSSTDPSFVGDMSQRLIGQVTNYVQVLPEDLRDGLPGQGALTIYIYMVGTDPLAYGAQDHYEVKISGYSTLPPRPTNTDEESYADDVAKWGTFRDNVWRPQYDAAVQSRDEALAKLASIELVDDQWSGICATTSALARVLPAGSPVIVCSDLENNQDIAYDGTLAGSSVSIIKPYTSGDVDYQHQLEDEYREYLVNMGVSESAITVYAPEQADAAFMAAFGQ
jgi:hypothetical protein